MRVLWLAAVLLASSCGLVAEGVTPTVTGAFSVKPVIELPTAKPGKEPTVTVISEGTGPRTRPGDVVIADVDIRQWTGNKPYMNTYDANQPTTVVFDGRHVSNTWYDALIGRPAGSRVMLVSPATKGFGPEGAPAGVDPADTLVIVFDVHGGYPADARLLGHELPTLPKDFRLSEPARTLIDGSGPAIKAGSKIVVQYIGAQWPSRTVFDSSHRRGGPNGFVLKPKAVPPGWVEALAGQHVGSRVAIAVPATATKGFTATTGGIGVPPGKPLVYVVDVIDVL